MIVMLLQLVLLEHHYLELVVGISRHEQLTTCAMLSYLPSFNHRSSVSIIMELHLYLNPVMPPMQCIK